MANWEKIKASPTGMAVDEYLSEQSLFEIMNVDRLENYHSKFLGWLFENANTRDFAIRQLIALLRNKQKEGFDFPDINGNDVIKSVSVNLEEPVKENDKNGRADIVIIIEWLNSAPLRIIIENKVYSKEHTTGKQNQTEAYYDYYIKDSRYINLFAFLTVDETGAACNQFISITYQDIMDSILVPLTSCSQTKDYQTLFKIRDYIKALSLSYSQDDIMAIDPFILKYVEKLWCENNAELKLLNANDFSDDEFCRQYIYLLNFFMIKEKIAKDEIVLKLYKDLTSKNYTRYSINGEGKYGKNKLVYEVIRLIVSQNSNISVKEINTAFRFKDKEEFEVVCDQKGFNKMKVKHYKDLKFEKRWKVLDEKDIYVRQTGWDGELLMDEFIKNAQELIKKDCIIKKITE